NAHLLVAANEDLPGLGRTILHHIGVLGVFEVGSKAAEVGRGFVHHCQDVLGGCLSRRLPCPQMRDASHHTEPQEGSGPKFTCQNEPLRRMDWPTNPARFNRSTQGLMRERGRMLASRDARRLPEAR